MDGQASIPVPEGGSPSGPCAWCGTTTRLKLTLAKARYTTAANGVRVVAKPAHEEWCCETHLATLQLRGDA